jgi:hypothetical protein
VQWAEDSHWCNSERKNGRGIRAFLDKVESEDNDFYDDMLCEEPLATKKIEEDAEKLKADRLIDEKAEEILDKVCGPSLTPASRMDLPTIKETNRVFCSTQTLPLGTNNTFSSLHFKPTAFLHACDYWRRFHSIGKEMIVSKAGRCVS